MTTENPGITDFTGRHGPVQPDEILDAPRTREPHPDDAARIERALAYASRYGQVKGDHHKMWVIDQMVRALLGCLVAVRQRGALSGPLYQYKAQDESVEYRNFAGCDPDYPWDEGIAP